MNESLKKKIVKIIAFVDWDNIILNIPVTELFKTRSLSEDFRQFKNWLESIGEVIGIFVFAPLDRIYGNVEMLQKLGIWTIPRARMPIRETIYEKLLIHSENELGILDYREIDTTDSGLRKFGDLILQIAPEITHICIGSGDADFLLFAERAKQAGKKVMIAVGDDPDKNPPLSRKLRECVDADEKGNPLIYIFSQ